MTDIGEGEIVAAMRDGLVLDCGIGGSRGLVDAEVIRKCCWQLRNEVDPHGLRMRNASIRGSLDLAGMIVPFPVRLRDCEFDSPIRVEGADLSELTLRNSPHLPGLLANGVRIHRDLNLSGSRVSGELRTTASTSKRSAVWLCESEIGGRLLCADTVIDGCRDRAIQADRMRVSGNVRLLHRFTACGEIRMIGTHIGGSLDLTGAHIESPVTRLALDLGEAEIDGSVFVVQDSAGRRPVVRGRIDMGRARVGGQFLIRNADLVTLGELPETSAYSRARASGVVLSAPRLSVAAELTIEGSSCVHGGIDLSMGELSNLSIGSECVLRSPGGTALNMTNTILLSTMALSPGITVQGMVTLDGAHVRGTLDLRRAALSNPASGTLISAQGSRIDGDVDMSGLRGTSGRLRFANATLGGVLATGAQLDNQGDFTLSLHQATVNGSVVLADGFVSDGAVILTRASIGGRLECTGGTFLAAHEHGSRFPHAIEAMSAIIRGGMELDWAEVSPSIDLTNAVTTSLTDDPANWPPSIIISGFTYDRFGQSFLGNSTPWDHIARRAWLNRQPAHDAGPYEQAAQVYRRHGYTEGAKAILIAKHRRARSQINGRWSLARRAVNTAYDATVGYGYRPVRALALLIGLLALVTGSLVIPATQTTMRATTITGVTYTTHGPIAPTAISRHPGLRDVNTAETRADNCGGGQIRCFNPFLYAIDTVIPLISLDQRSTWYPEVHAPYGTLMQWWLNIATILGWVLSTIFVLSLANLARTL